MWPFADYLGSMAQFIADQWPWLFVLGLVLLVFWFQAAISALPEQRSASGQR